MAERERRIQEIAYLLWEGEGRPDGQAERFWHMAEAAYEAEVEMTGGDKGETPETEAETVLSDVAEVEEQPAGVPVEAEATEAPAPKKRSTKPKAEDKPKAAKPSPEKPKFDFAPTAARTSAAESDAKPKPKKSKP